MGCGSSKNARGSVVTVEGGHPAQISAAQAKKQEKGKAPAINIEEVGTDAPAADKAPVTSVKVADATVPVGSSAEVSKDLGKQIATQVTKDSDTKKSAPLANAITETVSKKLTASEEKIAQKKGLKGSIEKLTKKKHEKSKSKGKDSSKESSRASSRSSSKANLASVAPVTVAGKLNTCISLFVSQILV